MKRFILLLPLALLAAFGLVRFSASAEPRKAGAAALPSCPVMGEPVNLYVRAETKDGPVYFCCAECIERFEEKPDKYSKAVSEQRKALAALPKVQVACPISGKAVNPKLSVEAGGQRVFVCCEMCVEPLRKDFDKYKTKLLGSYTYQTICPVGGEPINPGSSMDMGKGQTVYFCCDECKAKFQAEPAKYKARLAEQGYRLSLPKKKSKP